MIIETMFAEKDMFSRSVFRSAAMCSIVHSSKAEQFLWLTARRYKNSLPSPCSLLHRQKADFLSNGPSPIEITLAPDANIKSHRFFLFGCKRFDFPSHENLLFFILDCLQVFRCAAMNSIVHSRQFSNYRKASSAIRFSSSTSIRSSSSLSSNSFPSWRSTLL